MTAPLVSIIIPVYNGEAMLSKCLEAVLNQSYPHFEIIAVDNNSTDNTKTIINRKQTKDQRLKYLFEPFRSRGAARNAGIGSAKGEIIVTTDVDCLMETDWLSTLTAPVRAGDEDIVQGSEQNQGSGYWTSMQQIFIRKYIKDNLYNGSYIQHLDTKNLAIRKTTLCKLGRFNRHFKNCDDFELKVRCQKSGLRIYYSQAAEVRHYHKSTIFSLIKQRASQGYWVSMAFFLHRDFFDEGNDKTIDSVKWRYFWSFFPGMIGYAARNSLAETIFEWITGLAWRAGIVAARLRETLNSFAKKV